MVFRILPHKFRAKARDEGPNGNRALRRKADPSPSKRNPLGRVRCLYPRLTPSIFQFIVDRAFERGKEVDRLRVIEG